MSHNEGNNKAVPQKIYHPRLFIYSAPFFSFSVPLVYGVPVASHRKNKKRHVMCLHNALRKLPLFLCVRNIFSCLLAQNFPNKPKGKQKEGCIYLKHLKVHNVRLVVSVYFVLFASSNASWMNDGVLFSDEGVMSSPFLLIGINVSFSEPSSYTFSTSTRSRLPFW